MALTPERIAELERLKALMQPLATEAQRKAQAIWNAEQAAKQVPGKAKGGLEKFLEPSKVKQRMYHGTSQDIKKFKPRQANSVFVTDSPDTAHFFAKNSEDSKYNREQNPEGGGQNIMPVHVQVTNPFDFENPEHMKALRDYEKANRYTDRSISNHIGSVNSGDWEAIETRKIQNVLKHLGHDAFYVRENGRKNLGIHDPRKIKSAIGNRGTYDINDPDITKAQGGTVNPFDYENPEHVNAVAGHAAKHKDFKQYGPKMMGEVLSTGHHQHLEDPRIQHAMRQAGHNAYHVQEKTGKTLHKMAQPVVKKAMGGQVQPSIAQMKMALNQNKFPSQSAISSIGAEEAPDMPVKAYVPPAGGQDGQLPVGGIDMSEITPGMQYMPEEQKEMQPPGQPGQPPQPPMSPSAGPSSPGQQSNILQMTPQGQAMAAMQPNAVKPQMASGGPVPVQNRPFMSAGQKPYPFMAKVGGSDNMPMDNQSMDNGATTFDIDNIQELAMGGGVDRYASKGGVKKKKAPTMYPPARPMSDADIAAHAERIVRQMKGLGNPNQRTLQQIERESNLPVDVRHHGQETHMPEVDYSKLKDALLMGIPGDPSAGGILPHNEEMGNRSASAVLHGIGERQFENPVPLFGGYKYGAHGNPNGAWAGNITAARAIQNNVNKLVNEGHGDKVYGQYVKMTPQSLDYALHNLDALLEHQQTHKLPKDVLENLNELMRNQKTAGHGKMPSFPGFEDPNEVLLHAQMDSKLRKKIVHLLSTNKHVSTGKQDWNDVIHAISHPELRNLETGVGGSAIIEMKPNKKLELSGHPTYSHDIPSELIGKSRYIVPHQIAYPRTHQYAQEEIQRMGKKVIPFNQMKMMGMREKIDEQYINQLGKYEQEMRKRLGYKKGGKVKDAKLSDNLDTMRLALTKKKAK